MSCHILSALKIITPEWDVQIPRWQQFSLVPASSSFSPLGDDVGVPVVQWTWLHKDLKEGKEYD